MLHVKIPHGEVCLTIPGLYLPGPLPVSLALHYTSQSEFDGSVGRGWHFPYDLSLEREDDTLVFRRSGEPLARFEPFSQVAPAQPSHYSLHGSETSAWTVRSLRDKLAYHFPARRQVAYPDAIADRFQNALVLERDVNGRLVSLTDPFSRRLDFSYGQNHVERVMLSGQGETIRVVAELGYSADGYLAWIVDALHARRSFGYDQGRLVSYANALRGVTHAAYDHESRCCRVWEDSGPHSRVYEYDRPRSTARVVSGLGHSTLYRFDQHGHLLESVDHLGGVTTHVRDAQGSLVAKLDPTGQTLVSYSATATRLARTDGNGETTTLELDDEGDLIAVVDAQGGRWAYDRDRAGGTTTLRTPAGNSWRREYDHMGRPAALHYPNGREVRYRWSADGRTQSVSDNLGVLYEQQFDLLGRIERHHGAGGTAFAITYNGTSQEIRNVDGTVRRYDYDALGNLTAFIDEVGATWRFGYDAYGRWISMTDPSGGISEREYDPEGRVTTVTNENGERLDNARDELGRIVTQRSFDGSERRYEYDGAGRLLRKIGADGLALTIEPDAKGRPLVRRFADGSVQETSYGIGDRLTRAADETALLELEYDSEYRTTAERVNGNEVTFMYGWARDPIAITSGERSIRFAYDLRGSLQQVEDGSDFAMTFTRDPDRRLEQRRFPSGLAIKRVFDPRGRLIQQEVVTRSGARLLSTAFAYDKRSNLVETRRSDRETLFFAHNSRGELTRVRRDEQIVRDYAYDQSGNPIRRNDQPWRFGVGNRLIAGAGGLAFDYDAEGRLTVKRSADNDQSFYYDAKSRLARVESSTASRVEFDYDFRFRRLSKTVDGARETATWAGDVIIEHRRLDGTRVAYLSDPITRFPLAAQIDGEWHAIVCDQHGAVTDVVRLRDETLVWSCDVLGFDWEVRIGDDTFPLPHRGAGQLFDVETQLCYQRARYYDAASGRFTCPDPIGVFGGLNLYRFCLNQPLLLTDPFGLQACLSEAECDAIFQDIERRAAHVDQRWNEMHTPAHDIPWEGAPPIGQPFPAAAVGAMGTPIAAGDASIGSIDSHIRAHDDEQRGLNRRIQDYYNGHCSKYEDSARAAAMEENINVATRSPSLPHLGL